MEFIVENYIWFIIGGIVILMAIVGYIADVTDFGRKKIQKKEKSEKIKEEKPRKEKNKKEKIVAELPIEQNNIEQINNESENIEQNMSTESLVTNLPFEESNDMSLEQLPDNTVNAENTTNETVDQSLFEPLPSIDQVFQNAEQPVQEENVTTEPVDISLQNEEINQDSEVESDDDIWKF